MRTLRAVVLVLLTGCEGSFLGGLTPLEDTTPGLAGKAPQQRADGPGRAPPRYTCDTAQPPPVAAPLRRLSKRQFTRTIDALVTRLAGPDAPAVRQAIEPALAAVPADRLVSAINKGHDGFERADQLLSQQHADAQYALAVALGRALTDTAARRERLFGRCATDATPSNDVACVDAFLGRVGPMVLRRPLEADDVTFYRQALRGTTASPEALADVVALLFAAPDVPFAIEPGGFQPDDAALPLPALANRLSYQLWNEPPDEALWAAATSGALASPDVYRAHVERLLADAKALPVLEEFFDEWFQLHRTPDLRASLGQPDYAAIVGTQALPASADGMLEDVHGAIAAMAKRSGSAASLLEDRAVYTTDPATAALYGAPAWDGLSQPSPPPSAARAGLLTRLAFMATGNASTHPILRGVRLRTGLLCDRLGEVPADAAAAAMMVAVTGAESERVRTVALTERGSCAGCHVASINPLGFAHEGFDQLGRERTEEPVYARDGTLLAKHPVDTRAVPRVTPFDDRPVADAVELTTRIVESGVFESCLVTQYHRFTFASTRETDRDGCTLEGPERLAREGASVTEVLRAMLLTPAFKARFLETTP